MQYLFRVSKQIYDYRRALSDFFVGRPQTGSFKVLRSREAHSCRIGATEKLAISSFSSGPFFPLVHMFHFRYNRFSWNQIPDVIVNPGAVEPGITISRFPHYAIRICSMLLRRLRQRTPLRRTVGCTSRRESKMCYNFLFSNTAKAIMVIPIFCWSWLT